MITMIRMFRMIKMIRTSMINSRIGMSTMINRGVLF